jgi:hypothetical protein
VQYAGLPDDSVYTAIGLEAAERKKAQRAYAAVNPEYAALLQLMDAVNTPEYAALLNAAEFPDDYGKVPPGT